MQLCIYRLTFKFKDLNCFNVSRCTFLSCSYSHFLVIVCVLFFFSPSWDQRCSFFSFKSIYTFMERKILHLLLVFVDRDTVDLNRVCMLFHFFFSFVFCFLPRSKDMNVECIGAHNSVSVFICVLLWLHFYKTEHHQVNMWSWCELCHYWCDFWTTVLFFFFPLFHLS